MFGLSKKSSSDAWLFACLGNPGAKYEKNRHNIGFMAADVLADKYKFPAPKAKFKGLLSEGNIGGQKVILLKPQTFMNVSGESVQPTAKFYKIPPERIVVFYDEIELPGGKVRAKKGGGNAGHNGLKSIDEHLPAKDYWRVRLGVGRPPHPGMDVADYVLGNFSKEEMSWVEKVVEAVAVHVPLLLKNNDAEFMNKVTLATRSE